MAAPDEQGDLWNSGRLNKSKVDPSAETEEWLGEASAEDVERAQAKPEDVYAQQGPPIERPVTRITHIQVERGDSFTYRIMAVGFALLLGSTFLQVLRAESLEHPKVVVRPSPSPTETSIPEKKVATRKTVTPEWDIPKQPTGPAELPTLTGVKAECNAGEKVKIKIEIVNRGTAPSKSSLVKIELAPEGAQTVKISGPLPPMGPGQQAAFDVETPFEMKVPLSSSLGQFRTQEGVLVRYDVRIEESK